MIFDLADDFHLDWESVRQIGSDLNVNVKLINRNRGGNGGPGSSLPPPIPGRSRTIQLIAAERNAGNIFEARRRILGGLESPVTANIPSTYNLRSTLPPGTAPPTFGNLLTPSATGPLPPLMLPSSPNMHSPVLSPSFWPPTPFSSPFCSPGIATCVVPNGQEANGPQMGNSNNGHRPRQFNSHNMNMNTPNNGGGGGGMIGGPIRFPGDGGSPDFRGPVNLMPEFDFHHHRRAPGFERSNTNPNIMVSSPDPSSLSGTDEMLRPSTMQDKKIMAMKGRKS